MTRKEKIDLLNALQRGAISIEDIQQPACEIWDDHPTKVGYCIEPNLGLSLSHDEIRTRFSPENKGKLRGGMVIMWCNVDLDDQTS